LPWRGGRPSRQAACGRRPAADKHTTLVVTTMDSRSRLQELLPKLVLAPSFLIVLVFVYGFIAYTGFLSLTDSRMLPSYNLVGLSNYSKLWALPHWWRAISNLAIFASL